MTGCPGRRGLLRCGRRDRAHSPQTLTAFSLPVVVSARALPLPTASSPRLMRRRPPSVRRLPIRRADTGVLRTARPSASSAASRHSNIRPFVRGFGRITISGRANRNRPRIVHGSGTLKRRLVREARRRRFEIGDFAGGRRGHDRHLKRAVGLYPNLKVFQRLSSVATTLRRKPGSPWLACGCFESACRDNDLTTMDFHPARCTFATGYAARSQ